MILNTACEYNTRQGLTWVGGNHLLVKNSKFNHTGKGKFSSPPGAGVNFEAESGPIRNGLFINCEFINNTGAGFLADSGDIGFSSFIDCTFWGTTVYSIWVTKPGFTFTGCTIYGAIVHGYQSPDDRQATKFIRCTFEDKPYNGVPPYGGYMIETSLAKRMSFIDCIIISNTRRLAYVNLPWKSYKPEEYYKFKNCRFIIRNTANPEGDLLAAFVGASMQNCTFEFQAPDARKKKYWISGFKEPHNLDLGGNALKYP